MAITADIQWVCSMAGYVINRKGANLKSPQVDNQLFFNSALKAKNEALKVPMRFAIFTYSVFHEVLTLKWTTGQLPQSMKHVAWVFNGFQTHSDRCRFGTGWGGRGTA